MLPLSSAGPLGKSVDLVPMQQQRSAAPQKENSKARASADADMPAEKGTQLPAASGVTPLLGLLLSLQTCRCLLEDSLYLLHVPRG